MSKTPEPKHAAIVEQINVPYRYPVYFSEHVFSPGNPLLTDIIRKDRADGDLPRVRIWMDSGLVDAQPGLPRSAKSYCDTLLPELEIGEPVIYPGGERVKEGFTHVNRMIEDLQEHGLCRHSYLVAVGGGALLDAAGFAAALVHRGVRLIRIPTTVLGQDDSGVGVKNSINIGPNKNFLGTFAPPHAVINDLTMLRTLSVELMLDGVAEAFKVAIIKDAPFFAYLCEHAADIAVGRLDIMGEVVRNAARLHLSHIAQGGDPFETGSSRPLDFGHWAAHRLEGMSGFTLRHGQAVAIGLSLDCYYAWRLGHIDRGERDLILDAIATSGLRIFHPLLVERDEGGRLAVIEGIEQFREHIGGVLAITLPKGIGAKIEVSEMDHAIVAEGIEYLRRRSEAAGSAAA